MSLNERTRKGLVRAFRFTDDANTWMAHHLRVNTTVEHTLIMGTALMLIMLVLTMFDLLQWPIYTASVSTLLAAGLLAFPATARYFEIIPTANFRYWALGGMILSLLVLYSTPLGPYIFLLWFLPPIVASIYLDLRLTVIISVASFLAFNVIDIIQEINIYSPLEYVNGALIEGSGALHFWREQAYLDISFALVILAIIILTLRNHRLMSRGIASEAHTNFLKTHDPLTGLPKEDMLEELIARSVDLELQEVSTIVVTFPGAEQLDILHGSGIKDATLVWASGHIDDLLRSPTELGIMGNWHFGTCYKGPFSEEDAEAAAKRVVSAFKQPLEYGGLNIKLNPQVGLSVSSRDGHNLKSLFRQSTIAALNAAHTTQASYRFYSETVAKEVVTPVRMRTLMQSALTRDEFRIVYQPRVDVSTSKIVGIEALLRWHNEEMGHVSPHVFIPIAEETDLILDIGDWVLKTSIAHLEDWRRSDYAHEIVLSINTSSRQFVSSDFLLRTLAVLEKTSIEPSDISFEISETPAMENLEVIAQNVAHFRNAGFMVSIDDFGTGYASLKSIGRLGADAIKIDTTFIQDIESRDEVFRVVLAMNTLAHGLNMKTVAEGVENQNQLEILKGLHVDEYHGFLYCAPLEAPDIDAFLRDLAKPKKRRNPRLFK